MSEGRGSSASRSNARRASYVCWLQLSLWCAARGKRPVSAPKIPEAQLWKRLPCAHGDCREGKVLSAYGFSALYDGKLQEVAVFIDLATRDEQHLAAECVIWPGLPSKTEASGWQGTAARIFDEPRLYNPYIVRCPIGGWQPRSRPAWVTVNIDGRDVGITLPVEQVELRRQAAIGACLAPLYNENHEQLVAWLDHYAGLGVDSAHVYWTNETVSSERGPDTSLIQHPPRPFGHALASWVQYSHLPPTERFYYGQQTAYNDCVYRHKYAYDYLLMFDADEFLVLGPAWHGRPSGLLALLQRSFLPGRAAMGLYRYAYRADCGQGRGEGGTARSASFERRYTHRRTASESKTVLGSESSGDKLIVRPGLVDVFYMHFLASAVQGADCETANVPVADAFLKHLRSYGDSCNSLVETVPV